ncbi:plasma membrane-type calcium-transporting ATPase [Acrasis kona]|uniref:Plasma membrane-type calcium-transporting ATPase n=1 Tax=Acrasis kona TaxID=1008807 RepID=A0AAW2YHR7_9EUKA
MPGREALRYHHDMGSMIIDPSTINLGGDTTLDSIQDESLFEGDVVEKPQSADTLVTDENETVVEEPVLENIDNSVDIITKLTSDSTPVVATSFETKSVNDVEPSFVIHKKDDFTSQHWRDRKKHIFILSNSGKPIFTRYGDENELNPVMSFFLAIVEFVNDPKLPDTIRTVVAGGLKFVYVLKGSLYFVAVSRTSESAQELALQLQYLYEMIIFILTEAVQDLLLRRSNFDLRNLLGGADGLLYSLMSNMSHSLSFSFRALEIVPIHKSIEKQNIRDTSKEQER